MKHSNVALFVPHNGCPHQCSFCNQKEITGQAYQPTPQDVLDAVNTARSSLGENTAYTEIAFFGGSFTAIDRNYMTELLSAASPFVRSGEFQGIRISTRPDAIDREVLAVLRRYGVTSIELGAQSMCDDVLNANHRGHSADDVVQSSQLIKDSGFSLGLQMMTGMYKSNDVKDKYTAENLADLQPDTVRIYPTVVMKGTELFDLYQKGEYCPEKLDDAVALCADLLQFFEERVINVIRLGLHDSDSLHDNMAAGAYHPAFRELCESEIIYKNTLDEIKSNAIQGGTVEFYVNSRSVSRFIGQKRKNLDRLKQLGVIAIVRQDNTLSKYEVRARQWESIFR
ncbi:MAG: radical SAM protein [Clostridia bacterium]|nr:radical SAM protein [Clostridia bacterium]